MKNYYLNRKLNIITDLFPFNCNLEAYITLCSIDDSIFIDTFRIQGTNQVIDFAYTFEQIKNYQSLLKYHFAHHNVDIDSVYLIRRSLPKDRLVELLKSYGIEV